jgi:hypothetical protein
MIRYLFLIVAMMCIYGGARAWGLQGWHAFVIVSVSFLAGAVWADTNPARSARKREMERCSR